FLFEGSTPTGAHHGVQEDADGEHAAGDEERGTGELRHLRAAGGAATAAAVRLLRHGAEGQRGQRRGVDAADRGAVVGGTGAADGRPAVAGRTVVRAGVAVAGRAAAAGAP